MRSRWLKLIVFLLLITIKEPAMAENLTVSDETRSDIAALVAAQDAAWNRGDAEAFAARALPDIVFTNIFGMFSVGKAPFLAQHERIFSTIYKGTTNHQQIQHITLVKPDVAIVETFAVVSRHAASPLGRPVDRRCVTRPAATGSGAAGGRLVDSVLSQRRREPGLRPSASTKTVKNDASTR